MPKENQYWTSVIKRIFLVFLAIILTIVAFKLAIFYMPFLIAFIISLIIEPLIKKLMKKLKITRRLSSIIVFIITFGIIIGLLGCGIATIISESSNLLSDFNNYYDNIYFQVQKILEKFNSVKLRFSKELIDIIEKNSFTILNNISNYFQNFLMGIVNGIKLIPCMMIYVGVTILALYFICTDKIYMLDELEHHLPERWMKELTRTHKRTRKSLRRIFKGTSNTYINFIYNISNRPLYNVFLWVKCRISTYYCSWNCLCRCSSNFRLRNSYGTLGNFIWIKWRFKIRFSNNWFMDYYVCNKTIY